MITALGIPALGVVGFIGALMIESFQRPRALPPSRRQTAAVVTHAGVWTALFSLLVIVLARPVFALGIGWALWFALVMVNNAKERVLREPFLFDDYDYFLDAVRHPRLFLPFLGGAKGVAIIVVSIGVVVAGWWLEPAWARSVDAITVATGLFAAGAVVVGLSARRGAAELTFRPGIDHRRYGLIAHLAFQAAARQACPEPSMPWRRRRLSPSPKPGLPNVVAVQSESFFDPRYRLPGIRPDVLTHFDRLAREGLSGKLDVPAFGANTIRSEFAFLSGVAGGELGHRQFSPYRFVQSGFLDATLASAFREAGYRTVCVHPYHGGFYRREQVMPLLGFDEFVDISHFAHARGESPYVDDEALADWVIGRLGKSDQPVFVFVITMENHGPLHLETPRPGESEDYFVRGQASTDPDATIYLRHLANADRMLGRLAAALKGDERPGALCWFGDHPPILPAVYARHGYPGRSTDYLVWRTEPGLSRPPARRSLHELGATLIDAIGWTATER